LEAAEEVARQLRLRDLAGLIVIDFIDMEDRKNNAAVEKRLKDKLKTDRARIQVGRISGFGLMEMSRQRLRPGMLESTTQPCGHCHGTGLIRSDDSMALQILRALEEEGTRKRSREVLLRAPVAVVNFLMNQKREHIALIEARYGMSVRIEADPSLISPDYSIEKFKTATRIVSEVPSQVISANASMMGAAVDEAEDEDIPFEEDEDEEAAVAETAEVGVGAKVDARDEANGDGNGRKKRRRRRRRRGGANGESGADSGVDTDADDSDEATDAEEDAAEGVTESSGGAPTPDAAALAPKKRSRARTRKPKAETEQVVATDAVVETAQPVAIAEDVATAGADAVKPKPKPRTRTRKPKAVAEPAPEAIAALGEVQAQPETAAKPA
ncbi:MAG: ribonuclease E/G, partial [Paracoccaceae bacterium]|nr:ribonuclease E/G [Paracoccaceae bacterium]